MTSGHRKWHGKSTLFCPRGTEFTIPAGCRIGSAAPARVGTGGPPNLATAGLRFWGLCPILSTIARRLCP